MKIPQLYWGIFIYLLKEQMFSKIAIEKGVPSKDIYIVFYEKGWQIEMHIPNEVWEAYELLVKRGYNKFVIED